MLINHRNSEMTQMKSKIFSLFGLGVLIFVILINAVSAVDLDPITEYTIPENTTHDAGSFDIVFDLTNVGIAGDLYWDLFNFTSSHTGLTFSFDDFYIALGAPEEPTTEVITATISFDKYQTGTITGNINVGDTAIATNETLAFSVSILDSYELSVSPSTIPEWENSTTITIKNEGNTPLSDITLTQSGDFDVSFNPSGPFTLAAGATQDVEVTRTTDLDDLKVGENQVTITATASDGTSSTGIVSFENPFCEDCQNPGELDIEIKDINVKEGFGDDEEYWYPLDEIEIEIEVENEGIWEIEDIEIQICLLDVKEGTCVMDEDDMSIDTNDFDLEKRGEDDEQTILINFKIDPDDLNKDNNNYELYIKATGKIDDNEAPEGTDGEKTCASDSKEIEIRTDENFIILDDFKFPEIVQCGAEVTISFDAWNIGDDKIDEDELYILVYNSDLKINKIIDVEDISALDNEKIEFTFNIPEDMDEAWYAVKFTVYDDEDLLSNDVYENSEDDEAIFHVYLKVEGGCLVEQTTMVSASLESGGQAGEELVITTTVTNTGSSLVTYEVNAEEYSDWASSPTIEPSIFILGAGESKEVLIIFNVDKEASGEKSFNILVTPAGGEEIKQPVSVSIESIASDGFAGITGNVISEGNWYLWAIGALNILLILIIIVVAMRVSKQ